MQIQMLGPLEVVADNQPIPLGGTRQRATLGFLLLQANRVVATSQLLKAVWAADDAPSSARKILQNAVWGLRGVLHTRGSEGRGSPALLTQAPGYMLRVEPDQVDLFLFERHAARGRAELAAGKPDAAARSLKEALGLWRGPALADLVETGISWMELSALQGARVDAMEDYFEAELERGMHHSVLGELETLVESEPLRERACSQLMLALYRCGRQADALNVYGRIRSALVENLGLEPGHELRMLQQAILTHDAVLASREVASHHDLARDSGPADQAVLLRDDVSGSAGGARPPVAEPGAGTTDGGSAAERGNTVPATTTAGPRAVVSERRRISVLLLRTELGPQPGGGGIESVDRLLRDTAAAVKEEVEGYGGAVAASIGSFSLALFGVYRSREDDPERAVRAAVAIRERLAPAERLAVHAAVDTGEALVRYSPDDEHAPPSAMGSLMDDCQRLLALVPPGEIRVSDRACRATETDIEYEPAEEPAGGWRVRGADEAYSGHHAVPIVDREIELEVLRGLLELARHRSAPHLVTLLGEGGVGKTRFVMELEHRITGRPHTPLFLSARAPVAHGSHPLSVQIEILATCCGIRAGDSGKTARAKLASTLHQLVQCEETAGRLLPSLTPLVDPEGAEIRRPQVSELLKAWYEFVGLAAEDRPLVLVVDDLHRADDRLLDCVEHLPRAVGPVPVVVIAAARPELLLRRPEWGSGSRQATTLTLEPLSPAAESRLQELLLSAAPGEAQGAAGSRSRGALPAGSDRSGHRSPRSMLRLEAPRPSRSNGSGGHTAAEQIPAQRQYT
ncbi:BTAD domain-containing putative transcriptional regulator [Streptomyces sp. NPDC055287]